MFMEYKTLEKGKLIETVMENSFNSCLFQRRGFCCGLSLEAPAFAFAVQSSPFVFHKSGTRGNPVMAINYSNLNHANLLKEMNLKYQYEKNITEKFVFEKVLTCFFTSTAVIMG